LPKHLGQDLLWLSSQDHYLEVKTKLGTELILMRLGDAVKELETYPGARIHRSHWVADASITHLEASEGRLFVHLVDEKILPISRTYRKVPSQRSWPTSRKTAP
jgi:DNA-binding LytR/AlgR family response regulator